MIGRICLLAVLCGVAATTAAAAGPLDRTGLIALASDRAENYPQPSIYVVSSTGGPRLNASREMAYGPAVWSPKGNALAFPGAQDNLVIRPDGSRIQRLRVGKWSYRRSDLSWSPDGKSIAIANDGDDRLYIERLGKRPRSLVHEATRFPSWSPSGRLIAFVVERLGRNDAPLPLQLYVIRPNGRGLRRMSPWSHRQRWFNETDPGASPSWSPDGRRLAFELRGNVRIVDTRSRRSTAVTRVGRVRDPVWSPTGNWIAFERLAGRMVDVYIVRPDGSRLRKLIRTGARETSLTWSPNGRELAYPDDRGVNVLDLRSGTTRLVDQPACRERVTWLAWSPRSTSIAFGSRLVANDTEIFSAWSDGSHQKQLTDNCVDDRDPAWSPRGDELAFTRATSTGSDLYLIGADGSSERNVGTSPTSDRHPTWSPAGDRLAFARKIESSWQLFTIGPDGGDLRQITTEGSNTTPAWSPLRDEIVYASTRDDVAGVTSQVYTTRPDGAEQRRVTAEQYGAIEPDWSPDGSSIVFAQQQEWATGLATVRMDGTGRRQLISWSVFTPWLYKSPDWSPDGAAIAFSTGAGVLLLPTDGSRVRYIASEGVRNLDPDWQRLP